jgi:hypothetical protein
MEELTYDLKNYRVQTLQERGPSLKHARENARVCGMLNQAVNLLLHRQWFVLRQRSENREQTKQHGQHIAVN